jgi:hypothetical protein
MLRFRKDVGTLFCWIEEAREFLNIRLEIGPDFWILQWRALSLFYSEHVIMVCC